jgi:CSLREA domain-containing protein
LAVPSAGAATFTVTRTDDPVPGPCDADCSLREAIRAANTGLGGDTIVVPGGLYRLALAGANEDAAATGDLDLTKTVTVMGAGASSTAIDAGGIDRVFEVEGGTTVEISGLTITGGLVNGNGGGISSAGMLRLVGVVVSGNVAVAANIWNGGGIDSNGTLTVEASTIAGNEGYNGGGLNVGGSATIVNSTIAGNRAGVPGANGDGGGISVSAATTVTVTNTTIAANRAFNGAGSGGGISGAATLKNTIVASNLSHTYTGAFVTTTVSDDCSGTITSQGHNLASDTTCALTGAGDRQGVDARLGSLAANGGQTQTMALLAGSPAIDGGDNLGCPAADQRGDPRPQGTACDIGAFEFDRIAPTAAFELIAQRLRAALRRGYAAFFWTDESASAVLRIFHRGRRVATGAATADEAGRERIRATFTRAAKRRLARAGRVTLSLRLAVTDENGNTRTIRKRVTLRR